jgi:hypothetical protein
MKIYEIKRQLISEKDLDSWAEENSELLANHGVDTELHSFTWQLVEISGELKLDVFYSPDSSACGSCEDEEISEDELCKHEWFVTYPVKEHELWEAR